MTFWQACPRWTEPTPTVRKKRRAPNPFEAFDPFEPFSETNLPKRLKRCLFELTGPEKWKAYGHLESRLFALLYFPNPHRISTARIARWCYPERMEAVKNGFRSRSNIARRPSSKLGTLEPRSITAVDKLDLAYLGALAAVWGKEDD